MPANAGHHASLHYLFEDGGFNSAPTDTSNKAFGANATLTTSEGSNNAVRVYEPNNNQAVDIIESNFEGSFSVEFTLTNPEWLGLVISTASGDAPTTWSGRDPHSAQILQGVEPLGSERVLSGCAVTSATLSVETNDEITVTLDGAYADESNDATFTSQPAVVERALHFGNATVSRGGTQQSLVQGIELSIDNQTDLINAIEGTRFPVDFSPKVRELTLDFTKIVEDDSLLERFYGGASAPQEAVLTTADAAINIAAPNGNTLDISLSDMFPDSYDRDGVGDPEADLEESLSEVPGSVSAEASGF